MYSKISKSCFMFRKQKPFHSSSIFQQPMPPLPPLFPPPTPDIWLVLLFGALFYFVYKPKLRL